MHAGDLVANRYRLDERIDGGGMGNVWRGFDTRLNRTVAVKVLHAGLSGDARFRARFQSEARAVAALQAPGVVSLYDYGEDSTPDGVVSYLIMELVKGRSLAALIAERGALSASETMRIIADAAQALDVAHREGIIHRDVKPANLLITDDGAVKIVDFGIARARGEAGLTETGMVMGTLAYCSPEHLRDQQLTPASDVYSLGIVAYECLAGRPPFAASNPGAAVHGHINQQPPPLPGHVPPGVNAIVMRALSKDPGRRPPSAAAFAAACREALTGGGTTAVMQAPPVPPATRRMPAAVAPVPEHRPTAASERFQRENERDEPPRGKGGMVTAVVAVLVGLALLAAILVTTRFWDDDDPASADDRTTDPTTGQAEEQQDDGNGDDQPQNPDNGNGGQDGQDDQNNDDDSRPMPKVVGEFWVAARDSLLQAGFTEIRFEPDGRDSATPCVVIEQDPPEQEEVELDDRVDLVVSGTEEDWEQCQAEAGDG